MDKKIGIVILNYNDSANVKRYLDEIKNYEIFTKIVIVDNNSSKENEFENLQKLANDKINVIKSDKNGGYSYGNNFGIHHLENLYKDLDYVIISNPDVSVKEEDIKTCIEFLNENVFAAIVAPRMHYVSGPARRSAWKKRTPIIDIANSTRLTQVLLYPIFKSGEYSKNDYSNEKLVVDNVSGSFFVADYKKFKEIGFFDDKVFLMYEEDIIGNKLKEKGYKQYILNNINFMHYDSQTIGKLMSVFKKQDILFDSRIYYQKVYNNASKLSIFILYILKYFRKFELVFEIIIRKIFKF